MENKHITRGTIAKLMIISSILLHVFSLPYDNNTHVSPSLNGHHPSLSPLLSYSENHNHIHPLPFPETRRTICEKWARRACQGKYKTLRKIENTEAFRICVSKNIQTCMAKGGSLLPEHQP